jgi:hypothetical protein
MELGPETRALRTPRHSNSPVVSGGRWTDHRNSQRAAGVKYSAPNMNVLGGLLLYVGLIGAAAGLVCLIKPLRIVGIRSRRRGLAVFGMAVLLCTAGVFVPIGEIRVEGAATRLDEYVPIFQFYEFHSVVVDAPPERVDAALRAVTPEEIRFYRTLTCIRRLAAPGRFGILNPPPGRPILNTFTSGGFRRVADEPAREILLGVETRADRPQRTKIGFNFRIEEIGPSRCLVTTETRVYASGRHMVRGFAAYWRLIYPGSALIRRSWLRAIRLRAERTKSDRPGLI